MDKRALKKWNREKGHRKGLDMMFGKRNRAIFDESYKEGQRRACSSIKRAYLDHPEEPVNRETLFSLIDGLLKDIGPRNGSLLSGDMKRMAESNPYADPALDS